MALYSVYEPPQGTDDVAIRAERLVFVKDGFCWPALFVPVLWLLYRRMWIEFAIFLVVVIAMSSLLDLSDFGKLMDGWCMLGLSFLLALEANELRGAALVRKGYARAGTAIGRSREEAEYRFLSEWLPVQEREAVRTGTRAQQAAVKLAEEKPARVPMASSDSGEVIGSFPRP